jgi:hypothetical protein
MLKKLPTFSSIFFIKLSEQKAWSRPVFALGSFAAARRREKKWFYAKAVQTRHSFGPLLTLNVMDIIAILIAILIY